MLCFKLAIENANRYGNMLLLGYLHNKGDAPRIVMFTPFLGAYTDLAHLPKYAKCGITVYPIY